MRPSVATDLPRGQQGRERDARQAVPLSSLGPRGAVARAATSAAAPKTRARPRIASDSAATTLVSSNIGRARVEPCSRLCWPTRVVGGRPWPRGQFRRSPASEGRPRLKRPRRDRTVLRRPRERLRTHAPVPGSSGVPAPSRRSPRRSHCRAGGDPPRQPTAWIEPSRRRSPRGSSGLSRLWSQATPNAMDVVLADPTTGRERLS
jgi:hypothetical protein